jgi:hypothetical protein
MTQGAAYGGKDQALINIRPRLPRIKLDHRVVTSYGPNIASADHCANPPSAAGASHRALTFVAEPPFLNRWLARWSKD